MPLCFLLLRWAGRYRIAGVRSARREYRAIRRDRSPLLVCANHLTLIDSAIVAWALGPAWWFLMRFDSLPWNVPERANFAVSRLQRALTYVMKCRPVTRGGNRKDVARVLDDVVALLCCGETVLVFPEAGRSRSGRVDREAASPGVGRIVQSVPGCRVLCIYLRGDAQETYSDYPTKGETFRLALRLIEPRSEHRGLRGSREIAHRIVDELADMEHGYFDDRERRRRPA